jgi:UDP-N-acetylmuramate: L-alanyl-gamma-D-glutamyl-meso-diaminopimelate ligase
MPFQPFLKTLLILWVESCEETGLNYRFGRGEWAVVEGDEYPSAFFDPSPKFKHYKPFGLILTSLEYDHADAYPDFDSLVKGF